MRRIAAGVAAGIAAVSLALTLGACAGVPAAQAHPAARAVVALLDARAARSTDAKAYQPYVSESAIATELASAASESASGSPIPQWRPPYVSSLATSTADVVVVWVPSKTFARWPAATDFKMERHGGGWVVVDAVTIEAGELPKPLATVGDTPAR